MTSFAKCNVITFIALCYNVWHSVMQQVWNKKMLDRSATGQPLITLKGVGIRRGQRWLVRDVGFSISPREIVTLIGPNGSGKSTTAKTATGVLKPDEGWVERKPGLKIGYVPQKLTVDWTLPLTVKSLMTLTGPLNDRDMAKSLDQAGIAHMANAEVQHLSGGEFQRALLARAIARKPDLLVLDEPVQGVDFNGEIALYELIRNIRNETGCGILLISHDLHVVMAETDTVICLNGHVCCRGTPAVVSKSPEYSRLFGARAAGALAVYNHQHDHTHLPDGRVQHADGQISDRCYPGDGHHKGQGHGEDHIMGDSCGCGEPRLHLMYKGELLPVVPLDEQDDSAGGKNHAG